MRIRSINIQGYGRFNATDIAFAPGLQVIMGPNERGKSTIRSFIADMLYGQKVNDTQRVFSESNELREPWAGDGAYGGALVYDLDDGRAIEVRRNFSRQQENIQVFDHATGEEITGSFERFRNRELDFARQHMGLSKDVFLNTATISHVTLDELGDNEALEQIREKLLALTDTGGGSGTIEGAMRLLSERVTAIGMSGAKSKPLARAREALRALDAEYRDVLSRREALADLARDRKSLVEQCQHLRRERQAVDHDLKTREQHETRKRLGEAHRIQQAIDTLTQQCLALSHARDLPRDRDDAIQALFDEVRTAERQQGIDEAQRATLEARISTEYGEDVGKQLQNAPDFPSELEQRLNESIAMGGQLADRCTETETLIQAAQLRMEEVRQQLAEMPDFSRLAADPVEWLSQLASSFSVALRARDEECADRDVVRREVDILAQKNEPHRALFEGREDFSELAREYALQVRMYESQKDQHASTLHTLQGTYAELQGESRTFLPIGGSCLVVALITGSLHLAAVENLSIITWVAAFVGLVFVAMWGTQRGHMRRLAERIEEAKGSNVSISKVVGDPKLATIDEMLQLARLGSVRELEAIHDQYRSVEMELKIRREALVIQEEKAKEAEDRVPLLLERFRETFSKAGEEIVGENDVQDAAGRAIARYQEYRETKRRSTTNRSVLERHEAELTRLQGLASDIDAQRSALEAEALAFIESNGLTNASAYATLSEAIAAYRAAAAQHREILGRQGMLGETMRELEARIAVGKEDLERSRTALAKAIQPYGVESIEDWNGLMEEADTYQSLREERIELEEDLAALLGEDTLASLEARDDEAGTLEECPPLSQEALRARIHEINQDLEAETDKEHALHLRFTEQSTSLRSLNELEEEQAALHQKVRSLETEGAATSYAMALMEDVARDTHAYVAPRLAEEASGLLEKITEGSYNEISLGRDLSIRVRIPETNRLHDAPEKSLSKGTVDQIYLALRLAFVQSFNANGEGIPMLLDDPFANYDDARLATTMALVASLVGRHQIILFTCREDVVSAAEQQSASIIRL